MKAARVHEYGDASVIRYEDAARPRPDPGDVLVRVAATSFNPTEAALRAGRLRSFLPVDLPYTLGWDLAGTVAEVGEGAEGFAAGDRVVGRLDGGGAAAEYVRAPAAVLAAAPSSLPLAHAAALASLVRPGGRIVSIATPIEPPADAGVTAMHMVARNDVGQLAALVRLVDAGAVAVDISASRPLAELAAVHGLSEAGGIRDKVVIVP